MKKFYCKDCKIEVLRNSIRCQPCSNIYKSKFMKEKKINVTHGKSTYQHYCEQCKKPITWRVTLCGSCAAKQKYKINPRPSKEKPSCLDCGKKVSNHCNKRCLKCSRIYNLKTITRTGCEIYNGYLMKSRYEVAYAKYLDKNSIRYEYELKTFDLGKTTYTPDFYLVDCDVYIEIKGWMRPDAKKKLKLFFKKNPDINLRVLYKEHLQQMGVKL